ESQQQSEIAQYAGRIREDCCQCSLPPVDRITCQLTGNHTPAGDSARTVCGSRLDGKERRDADRSDGPRPVRPHVTRGRIAGVEPHRSSFGEVIVRWLQYQFGSTRFRVDDRQIKYWLASGKLTVESLNPVANVALSVRFGLLPIRCVWLNDGGQPHCSVSSAQYRVDSGGLRGAVQKNIELHVPRPSGLSEVRAPGHCQRFGIL